MAAPRWWQDNPASRWFDNRRMRAKILIVGLLGLLVAGLVGAQAVAQMGAIADDAAAIQKEGLEPVEHINDVRRQFLQTRVDGLADEMAQGDGPEHEAFLADMDAVDAAMATFARETALDARDKELVAQFDEAWGTYQSVVAGPLLRLARQERWADYRALRDSEVKPAAASIHDALTALEDMVDGEAQAAVERAQDRYQSSRRFVYALLAIGLSLVLAVSVYVAGRIARSLRRASEALQGFAEGDLDQHVALDSADELGEMASALNAAGVRLGEAMRGMDGNAQALASASEELSGVSGEMTGSAQESASQAGVVSAAAEQVTRNVQTVATGTEEMSASIREIAQNASGAAEVAAQAVGVAESTSATVSKLGESSAEVGNVISVINSIAEQTNLLALNATIEAARAGEAGKGFAVVAGEVKELAQETAKATEDIGRRIGAIQSDTEAAVAAIAQISGIIAQINDTQTTIASAVEEQTATTNEMARNVAEAATGSGEIAENITGVARTAGETGTAAQATAQAAEELARMAAQMQQLVGRFHY